MDELDLKDLTVYNSPFPKIRLGEKNSGGYIICYISNIKYDILISGGIDNNKLFEEEFVSKYTTK